MGSRTRPFFCYLLANALFWTEHELKKKEEVYMNHKLKKQLTTAVLILIGLFVLFAIVGQIA